MLQLKELLPERADAAWVRAATGPIRPTLSAPLRAELETTPLGEGGFARLSGTLTNAGGEPVRVAELLAVDAAFELSDRLSAPVRVAHTSTAPSGTVFPPSEFATRLTSLPIRADRASRLRLHWTARDWPMVLLTDAAESAGLVVGLEWAECWRLELSVRGGPTGRAELRVQAGPARSDFWLAAGDRVPMPTAVVGVFSGGLSAGRAAVRTLLRSLSARREKLPADGARRSPRPPVSVWSPFPQLGGQLSSAEIRAALPIAAQAGVEVLVLEAGWSLGVGRGLDTGRAAAEFAHDPARVPEGLAELGRAVRAAGLGWGLGLDLERVHSRSALAAAHPDWLLWPTRAEPAHFVGMTGLDLGQSAAAEWALSQLDRLVSEAELDWLRLDGGLDVGPMLEAADGPGQIGRAALEYSAGWRRVLAELTRRHSRLRLEFGWSGGRRAEPGRWGVADQFAVAEADTDPDRRRSRFLSAADWLPVEALRAELPTGSAGESALPLWALPGGLTLSDPGDARAQRLLRIQRQLRAKLIGDAHRPSVPAPLVAGDWDGRQFHDADSGRGVLLGSRAAGPAELTPIRLSGLLPTATYRLSDPVTKADFYRTGQMLMELGVLFAAGPTEPERPHWGPVLLYEPA